MYHQTYSKKETIPLQILPRSLSNLQFVLGHTRAAEWKVIKNNPVANVLKPKVVHKEVLPYDESEVQALLIELQKEPFHWRMMITLALTTGLHLGELLGLKWKYMDLDNGIIDVA
ncbi:tyrosine-type recombinase/integrase [Brevibacillus sp. NRS-1366]|uniref:tyrosine-type recombinase/integrase n=1 Tax=Brevibacillus sp. NRS-1366 TaxID=3233899 RepID=UPI003D1FBD28